MTVYVFHHNQLQGEYPAWPDDITIPNGSYILDQGTRSVKWWLKRWNNFAGINVSDVPNTLKMLCLVLDIKL